eukprot:CCRYP_008114-RA/>CCRYP_008114-RA protein AED:0.06 eAED:0.06 QI:430/1/1/1/0.66/0.5/4/649/1224
MSSTDSRQQETANFSNTEAIPLSRGRQLNRASIPNLEAETQQSPVSVPLRFVHVPNTHCFSDALSHRTPSVPDFASFYNDRHHNSMSYLQTRPQYQHKQQQQTTHQHLSGEALLNAAGTDPMEQFEERLRRARLNILLDRSSAFSSRVRSKSTPARAVAREIRNEEEMKRRALRLELAITGNDGIDDKEEDSCVLDFYHQATGSAGFDKMRGSEHTESFLPAAPTTASVFVEESQVSPKTSDSNAETNNTLLHNHDPSCVSSTSPPLDMHRVLPPPPLPPPSSERERLVHREREARSETERARIRHLALLRERQLEGSSVLDREESGDFLSVGHVSSEIGPNETSHRNNRPTSFGSLDVAESVGSDRHGNADDNGITLNSDDGILPKMLSKQEEVAFCDIEHGVAQSFQVAQEISPQFSSDIIASEVEGGFESAPNNAIVDDEENILNHPSSPMSNLAFIASFESTSHRSGISDFPLLPPPATERERRVLREREARLETERARRRHIALLREHDHDDEDEAVHVEGNLAGELGVSTHTHEETASAVQHDSTNTNCLSYTMERFLETLGDEVGNRLTADGLIADGNDEDLDADTEALPYTMELFLSENMVVVDSNNDGDNELISGDVGVVSIENDATNVIAQQNRNLVTNHEIIPDHESNCINESGFLSAEDAVMPVSDMADESNNSIDGGNYDLGAQHIEGNTFNATQDLPNDFSGLSSSVSIDQLTDRIRLNLIVARPNNDSQHLITSTDVSVQHSDSTRQMPRLTESDVAQLTEVEHASTGNAPPQSLRDEPSISSIAGPGTFRDHAFSIATQTTVVESCTVTSQGSTEINGALLDQHLDEDIIRVDDSAHDALLSFPASNASVEAMPSVDSVVDSDSESHILSKSSSSELNSSPQSAVLESHSSLDEESQILNLTEAGIVTMADIDHASIGNAPPHSIRDERLSESSVLGRSQQSRYNVDDRMFVNPHSGLACVDTVTANASVEAMPSVDSEHSMSQDSIDALPSEYNENSLHESSDTGDEDLAGFRVSDMASSTSIEALPSVDLRSEPEDDPLLILASFDVANTHNTSNNRSNGVEEDLVIYQASDRASSTSIEVLPSDDIASETNDVHSSILDAHHFIGGTTSIDNFDLEHFRYDNINSNQNDTESSPLLPIVREQCVSDDNGHGVGQSHRKYTWTVSLPDLLKTLATAPILVSFISGCLIGLCIGILLFGYRVSGKDH